MKGTGGFLGAGAADALTLTNHGRADGLGRASRPLTEVQLRADEARPTALPVLDDRGTRSPTCPDSVAPVMCTHRRLDDPEGLLCDRRDPHDRNAAGGHTYTASAGPDLADKRHAHQDDQ